MRIIKKYNLKLLFLLVSLFVTFSFFGNSARAANVNNFVITNYQIEYHLSKDSSNVSQLTTKETIEAQFPDYDHNHGIERSVPNSFNKHSTDLMVNSVTSSDGTPMNYTTYSSGDNTVIRIGDAQTYVHGFQTYVISYSQQNVTKFYQNSNDDEFYWSTNGTGWSVPINELSVTLYVDDALASSLNKLMSCYQGSYGSTDKCEITSSGNVFQSTALNLTPGQTTTIAIGFTPHTFAEYKMSLALKLFYLWIFLLFLSVPISLVLAVWIFIRYRHVAYRKKDIGTIIPQYVPPKEVSVSVGALLVDKPNSMVAAQIIDLAIKGYLKIYQTKESSIFSSANFQLEIVKDVSKLRSEEKQLLYDLFESTDIGTKLDTSSLKTDTLLYNRLKQSKKRLKLLLETPYGLIGKNSDGSKKMRLITFVALVLLIFTLSPLIFVIFIASLLVGAFIKPLTEKGLEIARYIDGLELYITVAEADRIKMLQGPDTAEKIGTKLDTGDHAQLVKLYEKTLPYAIIFGLEKQWSKQLEVYYKD